jgi:hypothetical protein
VSHVGLKAPIKEQRMRTKPSLVEPSAQPWHSLTLLRALVLLAAGLPATSFPQTYDQWLYTNSVHYGAVRTS